MKKKIMQYNKFDIKVPILVIPKDPHNPNHITFCQSKKSEYIQSHQFMIVGRQRTIVIAKMHFFWTLIPHKYCIMICNEYYKILT